MDDQTRLAALVDAYMTQLASVTHQLFETQIRLRALEAERAQQGDGAGGTGGG